MNNFGEMYKMMMRVNGEEGRSESSGKVMSDGIGNHKDDGSRVRQGRRAGEALKALVNGKNLQTESK